MRDRATFRTLTGHLCCPVPPVLGWWLVEDEPGSHRFSYGFTENALAVMREHNRLWAAKHGEAAVAAEQEAHAELCARIRQMNIDNGVDPAEYDREVEKARRRYAGESTAPAPVLRQSSIF